MDILKSLSIFILAGLCEIGGGYLIWQSLKEEKPFWYGLIGAVILDLYSFKALISIVLFSTPALRKIF